MSTPQKMIKIGLNADDCIDFVIDSKFTVGVEYRYSEVKFDSLKFKTHNVGVKLCYQFWF